MDHYKNALTLDFLKKHFKCYTIEYIEQESIHGPWYPKSKGYLFRSDEFWAYLDTDKKVRSGHLKWN